MKDVGKVFGTTVLTSMLDAPSCQSCADTVEFDMVELEVVLGLLLG